MDVFAAVADPARRQIMSALARGDLSAGEVAALFPTLDPLLAATSGFSGRPAWSMTKSSGGAGSTASTWTGWLKSRRG